LIQKKQNRSLVDSDQKSLFSRPHSSEDYVTVFVKTVTG